MASADGFTADVPVGPPCPPPINPGKALETALQAGIVDAKANIHDDISLRHDAELIFHLDVDRQLLRAVCDGDLGRNDAEQSASWLLVQKTAIAHEALRSLEQASTNLESAKKRLGRYVSELMGEGEYTDSTWKDPSRVEESRATTNIRAALPPTLLAVAETGVNALALQTLGGGLLELISFALVLGAATVTAGHTAGTYARAHAGEIWQRRWLVPAGLAGLVMGVVLFVASLRVAFVDAPQVDPTTGSSQASMLTQAGVAPWVVWAGLGGLQLIFFAVTALQACSVHNPLVRALQRVRAEVAGLEEKLPDLARQESAAQLSVEMAVEDQRRVPAQWQSYTTGLVHLGEQMKTTYAIGYTRQAGDPNVTVAMEARIARPAGLGGTAPSVISTPVTTALPAPAAASQNILADLTASGPADARTQAPHPNGVVPTTTVGAK